MDVPGRARVEETRPGGMKSRGWAIEARALGKNFGPVRALDQLDLQVSEGEFFGFLGPNGAGKTTTLHLFATLLRPSRGTALVFGRDIVRGDLAVRQSIGLVFQETTLDRDLSAEENLRFAGRLWGLPESTIRARTEEVLRPFDLFDRRNDLVRTFSGGMRRAVEVARGLLHRPRLLFLDEPTTGLDPRARRTLWSAIHGLRASLGMTLFLTTHYVEEAEPCDRVAILDRGRIVALGSPAELKSAAGVDSLEDVFLATAGRSLPEAHAPMAPADSED